VVIDDQDVRSVVHAPNLIRAGLLEANYL